MNVVKFNFNRFLDNDNFRSNTKIEPIYFEIAELVLSHLYKAFPFDGIYNGDTSIESKDEWTKLVIVDWADCFMDWKIDNKKQAIEAVRNIIYMHISPTIGLFRAVYMDERPIIETHIYREYVNYLYRFCMSTKDGLIYGAKDFASWNNERKNKNNNHTND